LLSLLIYSLKSYFRAKKNRLIQAYLFSFRPQYKPPHAQQLKYFHKKPSRSEKDLKGFIISAKPYLTEGIFREAYLGTAIFQRRYNSASKQPDFIGDTTVLTKPNA